MPYRVGLLLYPVFILLTTRSKNSAAAKFIEAGATAPETARRPESLQIPQTLGLIASGVKTGVLVPTGDGRYYVDLPTYRRRRRAILAVFITGSALFAAAVLMLVRPWQ